MENLNITIKKEKVGERIDKFLSLAFNDKSRAYFQNLIDNENVLVNEKSVKSNYKLRENDKLEINIPEPIELKVEAEDIPLNIVYEDQDLIVINKPQGMVVHPAPGNYTGTLVNALLCHCKDLSGINGIIRPGIVHRIDKDTSGILVMAKNDNTHNDLAEQFKKHSIKREYVALVEGRISKEKATIETNIGRNPKDRFKYAVVKEGKHAITHYEVIEVYNKYTLTKCILETGRTHQIRVHMNHIGHPLVGDILYGFKKQAFKLNGQMLHAKTLGFIHPRTKKYLEFTSELPNYFNDILNKIK